MIPADIDLEDLAFQLQEDRVAIGGVGQDYPIMEGELLETLAHADARGFGSTGIVVLDQTPVQAADQRDIAQELLNLTGVDTVIVRSPGSGAIVSDIHSRSDIESAQWHFLGNNDYVAATRELVDRMVDTPEPSWILLSLLAILFFTAVAVLAWFGLGRGDKNKGRVVGERATV
ncbi:hypothetical protein COCCU_07550 [Corynebacterium occultum]|uniref:1-deoxy-D-xylulose-5-phosphate synthase n=1 Tax=Corynebacterium occultum TaxID=2675219 RepID=A0A6B8VTG7_9CORY|nr:DUF6676 family protein [Corynebacterium occultum]QGU07443.1 hypothetical protein COCCU_07550 [Corynebacterium occultum]